MAQYYSVIGNRDYIKLKGERRPYWEFLDVQPDGWLTSLVYMREDLPHNQHMIFDCGAWSYRNEETPRLGKAQVTPHWALEKYQQRAQPGDFVVAPDHMLIPGVDLEVRRRFNYAAADDFLAPALKAGFKPMATVHGHTLTERIETAQLYYAMGYDTLALGGLAARASQKSMLLDTVLEIRRAVPYAWLHVLGLSAPSYAAAWHEYDIDSYDGSSHFKQAFTAGSFFTREGTKLVKHQAARTERGRPDKVLGEIVAPLCYCRACSLLREDGVDTRTYGSNEHNMGRAAHNLNMLMAAQKSAISGDVVLVSCVGGKQEQAAPAGELYQSSWFYKARTYAEQVGSRWYILSAKHHLLDPMQTTVPYELTLNRMPADQRQSWAQHTHQEIKRLISPEHPIIILAGQKYREYLLPLLEQDGYHVSVPMQGLGIGQQLAWLDEQTTKQLRLL